MKAKILSLNIGHPKEMPWQGKSIISSMEKHSVPGPLVVHFDHIEGNSFANPNFHGTNDSLLYAYGLTSIQKFIDILGVKEYVPGATGETLTVDHLPEDEISVGDVFKIGEVEAQAVFPRIPCGKVNFRMQNERGQKAMQEAACSGIYFRILQPGKIHLTDTVKRTKKAVYRFSITDLYEIILTGKTPSAEQIKLAEANGAFQKKLLDKWLAL